MKPRDILALPLVLIISAVALFVAVILAILGAAAKTNRERFQR